MLCKFAGFHFEIHLLMLVFCIHSVDESILQHMIDSQAEFLMEVTDKTKADIKVRNSVPILIEST